MKGFRLHPSSKFFLVIDQFKNNLFPGKCEAFVSLSNVNRLLISTAPLAHKTRSIWTFLQPIKCFIIKVLEEKGRQEARKVAFSCSTCCPCGGARVPVIRNITNGKTNSHPRHMVPVSKTRRVPPAADRAGVIWCGRAVSLAGLTSQPPALPICLST